MCKMKMNIKSKNGPIIIMSYEKYQEELEKKGE